MSLCDCTCSCCFPEPARSGHRRGGWRNEEAERKRKTEVMSEWNRRRNRATKVGGRKGSWQTRAHVRAQSHPNKHAHTHTQWRIHTRFKRRNAAQVQRWCDTGEVEKKRKRSGGADGEDVESGGRGRGGRFAEDENTKHTKHTKHTHTCSDRARKGGRERGGRGADGENL